MFLFYLLTENDPNRIGKLSFLRKELVCRAKHSLLNIIRSLIFSAHSFYNFIIWLFNHESPGLFILLQFDLVTHAAIIAEALPDLKAMKRTILGPNPDILARTLINLNRIIILLFQ